MRVLLSRLISHSLSHPPSCKLFNRHHPRLKTTTARPPPPDPSLPHHTLPTFLLHAHRTSLSQTSTVYVGTHYEYTVLTSLSRFGLSLSRTGGRLDKGIDLLGTWNLPDGGAGRRTRNVRALVQCKALKKKAGPSLVRELEGAFNGVPRAGGRRDSYLEMREDVERGQHPLATGGVTEQGDRTSDYANANIIALLSTPLPATKGIRDALSRSRYPMAYVMTSLAGRVTQLLWNRAAAEQCGLGGLSVGVRYLDEVETHGDGNGGVEEGKAVGEEDGKEGKEGKERGEGMVGKALASEVILLDGEGGVWEGGGCVGEKRKKKTANIARAVKAGVISESEAGVAATG